MLISQLKSALISIWLLVGFGGGFWGFLFVRRKKRKLFSSTSINKIEIIPMQGKREGKREKNLFYLHLPFMPFTSFATLRFATLSTQRMRPYPAGTWDSLSLLTTDTKTSNHVFGLQIQNHKYCKKYHSPTLNLWVVTFSFQSPISVPRPFWAGSRSFSCLIT